jgi:Cdc6-like AAA superfamily ATPase
MRSGFGAGRGHLIEDGVTLSDEAVAGKVIARKREQDQLQACLAPMVRGQPPLNTYLWGPPGSGKTTLARWALRGLSNAATRVGVYVNCWQHRTLYSVLHPLVASLIIYFP